MIKGKRLRIISILGSLVLFLAVIVLTHDSFDGLEMKNIILVILSLCQFGIIVYVWTYKSRNKE